MRCLNTYKDCADRTWFGKLFQQLVCRHANEKDLALFVQCVLKYLSGFHLLSLTDYIQEDWGLFGN